MSETIDSLDALELFCRAVQLKWPDDPDQDAIPAPVRQAVATLAKAISDRNKLACGTPAIEVFPQLIWIPIDPDIEGKRVAEQAVESARSELVEILAHWGVAL